MTAPTVTRAERRAEARTWAGYRSAAFARTTGTLVVVLNGHEAGYASGTDPVWYTHCADHGVHVGHPTLALARWHAADPEGWCGVCNGTDEPDPMVDAYPEETP